MRVPSAEVTEPSVMTGWSAWVVVTVSMVVPGGREGFGIGDGEQTCGACSV
jgi:hypothetical protein